MNSSQLDRASLTTEKSPVTNFPDIEVTGLHKNYGKLAAIRGIDFTVQPGEIFGLIGPDGAGKTTTFQILAGVMSATAGKVEVVGKIPRDARLAIGYLTQKFSLYLDLSLAENIRYSAGLREISAKDLAQRSSKYLRLMNLEKFSDRLAGKLSGGMKQKLALCCALISQPQVLLLDEPTTGVDPVSRREFWDVLASLSEAGMTMVVATPYMDEAERCHRVALMHEGQIQQTGTPAELRNSLGLHRLEVRVNNLEAAEQTLSENPTDFADVQTFGDRLDVLVQNPEMGESQVRNAIADSQLQINSIRRAEPTLENVFVNRLRQQGFDPPFIPLPRLNPPRTHQKGQVAIGTNNLSKTFGSFQAVKNVTLDIGYGEIYGLLGANGAGKTTTIKMLCGLLEASGGDITLAGQTSNLRSSQLRQRLGYMSQKFSLYDDISIIENLKFYCGVYGIPRRHRQTKIDWVLEICGLTGKEKMITGQLPGGWKQRVAFGAAVMHEPEILFLDEPTSGVDPLARRQFWRLIEDLAHHGTAVLVTTHYLEEAEHCHQMCFMVAGEVVAEGTPSQIKTDQPGQLFEVTAKQPQTAANLLKQQLDSWRVSLFGDRLHLILDNPDLEMPQVRSQLQNERLEVGSFQAIPFSLEDSFISIVQRSQRGES
ncbi:ABC transporter ATP-binding protein [Pleurocapsales cyanobacterium LEGE 10410]|nr:ABC transporter ATP-binding protein [Pleurocapsales cyanobacterium LEGE 10410]